MQRGVINVHMYSNAILPSKRGNAVAADPPSVQIICKDGEGLQQQPCLKAAQNWGCWWDRKPSVPERCLLHPRRSSFPKSCYQQLCYSGVRRGPNCITHMYSVGSFFLYIPQGLTIEPTAASENQDRSLWLSREKARSLYFCPEHKEQPPRPFTGFALSIAHGTERSASYNVLFYPTHLCNEFPYLYHSDTPDLCILFAI